MIDQFRTVYRGGTGEIVEKKSRFIATVRLVESEEEALSCLEALRKKYWDSSQPRKRNTGMRGITVLCILLEKIRRRCAVATTGSLPARQGGRCSMWYREQASAMCLLW